MTTAEARIVLLRHGETEWARTGRHTSHTDVPLTANGEQQARAAGARIAALGLRDPMALTSPLVRGARTAELAGLNAMPWDALVEWDYGDYEGLTTPEIRESVPGWTVFTHPCPGGEKAESVQARADMVLAIAASCLDERDVALVGHGHFSRALLARWAGLPVLEGRRFAASPGSLSVLGFEHGTHQIVSLNIESQSPNEERNVS
ncbi:acid phosphatase [Rhodococcus sp. NPDC059234]|uniref:acid phosphatase n=1 Tax=Rhodococcus sp. NPDC059234 TaxID=3346781 RepID=UPI003672C7D3